jgi:hypothetical protein
MFVGSFSHMHTTIVDLFDANQMVDSGQKIATS